MPTSRFIDLNAVGTVNLVVGTSTITGGASGGLVYDNAGVVGEIAAGASGTVLVGGTTPAYSATPTISRLTVTGGTVTASTPLLSGTETWNNAGVSFIGTTYTYTETASAAGSRYLQILGGAAGATDEFYVQKGGTVFANGALTTASDLQVGAARFMYWNTRTQLSSPSDGLLLAQNTAGTDFSRLLFGGTTSSFPAIKRSSTTLAMRLADDSGDAPTSAASFTTGGYSSGARSTSGAMQSVTAAVTLSGATTATSNIIPAGASVVGVATTTTTTITGATGYQVGDGTTATRYGDITGTAIGTASGSANYTADPYWFATSARAITLTAKTSNFTGGVVQVTVFYRTAAGA